MKSTQSLAMANPLEDGLREDARAKGYFVLYIEDNEADAKVLGLELKGNLRVREALHATSAEDAIHKLSESSAHPDLLLVDLGLPNMTGLEFIEIVKMIPKLKRTPAVMITGQANMDAFNSVSQKYNVSYVLKPQNRACLRNIIDFLLDHLLKGLTLPKLVTAKTYASLYHS